MHRSGIFLGAAKCVFRGGNYFLAADFETFFKICKLEGDIFESPTRATIAKLYNLFHSYGNYAKGFFGKLSVREQFCTLFSLLFDHLF